MKTMFDIHYIDEKFILTNTANGKNCDFLRFLINTSSSMNDGKPNLNVKSLLSKCCAIGYLLIPYKDRQVAKAVIATGNDYCGKSMFAHAITYATDVLTVSGKTLADISTDTFIWDDMTDKTKIVILDDLCGDSNFECLFSNITGDWTVNRKCGCKYIVPFEQSPKLLITADNFEGSESLSHKNRQWIIRFSDYYNENVRPIFKKDFFVEWDKEQWYLFYGCLAVCVQLYLRYGVIESDNFPIMMGEMFLLWAENYFALEERRNCRIAKSDLQDDFKNRYPEIIRNFKPTQFRTNIIRYCEWKGWTFNRVLSGGVEYFIIGD
jgi:hypothetical protein